MLRHLAAKAIRVRVSALRSAYVKCAIVLLFIDKI